MTTAAIRKTTGERFNEAARPQSADIIVLYAPKLTNEEIRQRQYEAQKKMYDEARAAAQEQEILMPVMLGVQHQPVREISRTAAEQAAMQGEKGFAFKL